MAQHVCAKLATTLAAASASKTAPPIKRGTACSVNANQATTSSEAPAWHAIPLALPAVGQAPINVWPATPELLLIMDFVELPVLLVLISTVWINALPVTLPAWLAQAQATISVPPAHLVAPSATDTVSSVPPFLQESHLPYLFEVMFLETMWSIKVWRWIWCQLLSFRQGARSATVCWAWVSRVLSHRLLLHSNMLRVVNIGLLFLSASQEPLLSLPSSIWSKSTPPTPPTSPLQTWPKVSLDPSPKASSTLRPPQPQPTQIAQLAQIPFSFPQWEAADYLNQCSHLCLWAHQCKRQTWRAVAA